MHGDAAFAGQGLVAESLELSDLRGFGTGGTVHIIVNNQIGFTTSPSFARSSPYPSMSRRGAGADLSRQWRRSGSGRRGGARRGRISPALQKDVVIDLFCYRRHGHNESDEPAFTQPLMYRTIARHPTTRQLYAQRLVGAGVISEADVEAVANRFIADLEAQFAAAGSYRPNKATGWKAPGPGWKPLPMMTAAATPRRRSNYCARLGIASSRFRMAFTSTARSPDNWKRSAPRSNPVTASIGRPPRRWRSAHCVPREPTSVSPAG